MNYFRIDGNYYIIKGLYDYEIRQDSIQSGSDLECWIGQLLEKNWCSPEIIKEFVLGVVKHKGWIMGKNGDQLLKSILSYATPKRDGGDYHGLRRNRDLAGL